MKKNQNSKVGKGIKKGKRGRIEFGAVENRRKEWKRRNE